MNRQRNVPIVKGLGKFMTDKTKIKLINKAKTNALRYKIPAKAIGILPISLETKVKLIVNLMLKLNIIEWEILAKND